MVNSESANEYKQKVERLKKESYKYQNNREKAGYVLSNDDKIKTK